VHLQLLTSDKSDEILYISCILDDSHHTLQLVNNFTQGKTWGRTCLNTSSFACLASATGERHGHLILACQKWLLVDMIRGRSREASDSIRHLKRGFALDVFFKLVVLAIVSFSEDVPPWTRKYGELNSAKRSILDGIPHWALLEQYFFEV
jgi:hypothetical protein